MAPIKKGLSRREFLRLSMLGTGVLVTACGSTPTAPGSTAPTTEGAAQAPPTQELVKLRYQSREPEMAGGILKLWEVFYPKFKEANPNIDVEFLPQPSGGDLVEQTVSSIVAGTAADIIEMCCWQSTHFVQLGETLSLQPYIDRDSEEVNLDDYYPHQFDPWKKDGSIHLMPRFTGTMVVYYNKDMFDEEGVAYPPKEWGAWTWTDYEEMGQKFVKTEQPFRWGTSNYGMGANWLTQYWVRGFGGHMVDPHDSTHCTLGEPKAMEALNWIHKIIWDDKMFAQGDVTGGLGVLELFLGGRIAMMEMGPWNLGPVAEGATFKWDVAPMPDGPAGPTTHQSVDGSFIWKGTKHPDESWTLLKWLTSPMYGELYAQYATKQPSRKSVLPFFVKILREQNPIYQDISLEVFTSGIEKGIGGPEEMFAKDQVSKEQILKVAFDKVMLLGKAPVGLIARYADIVTKFNRGEITVDGLGAAMEEAEK